MSKFTLPPKKQDIENTIKKTSSIIDEKKISDVINKGGSITKKNSSKEAVFKNFNIKILESELNSINELREKFPKPRGKRIGISLHDWIIAAITEKINRDNRK